MLKRALPFRSERVITTIERLELRRHPTDMQPPPSESQGSAAAFCRQDQRVKVDAFLLLPTGACFPTPITHPSCDQEPVLAFIHRVEIEWLAFIARATAESIGAAPTSRPRRPRPALR